MAITSKQRAQLRGMAMSIDTIIQIGKGGITESVVDSVSAALARELFGIPDGIYSAIRWHTTGKPDMSLMEKIIYLADFTEPTRDFEGVEPLRKLCFEDIDRAMELGLRMSLEEIRSRGEDAYRDTVDAYLWYKKEQGGSATC